MNDLLPSIAHPAFLVQIDVPDDRSLRIVLEERTALGPEEDGPFGLVGREIVRAPEDGTYEIRWDLVVCFAVRGDPFPREGANATIAEFPPDSGFMRWVISSSYAEPDYVAAMKGAPPEPPVLPLRHWSVSCNEVQFDVASPDPPSVRRLTP